MAGFRTLYVVCVLAAVGALRAEPVGNALVEQTVAAVRRECSLSVQVERSDDWTHAMVEVKDEEYPLSVDLLAARHVKPGRIIYLLPPSGVNSLGVYAGGGTNGLAHFLAQHGYVVIGITPREDRVPTGTPDSVMAGWGLAKHRQDVRKIVTAIQSGLKMPHDMLGFSFGAVVALDYCGAYADDPERLFLLDIHTMDPSNVLHVATASVLESGYEALLEAGICVDPSLDDLRMLLGAAAVFPDADSGIAREWFALPAGDFTMEGMLHFWLIYSGILPGIHSGITGLPRDWPLIMSTTSGWYIPAADPLEDEYGLFFSGLPRLRETASLMGSGKIPIAFLRDMTSATGHCGAYSINWTGIKSKVRWINAELGYGNLQYGADLIRAGGNTHVETMVIPGYGNADVVFSDTASTDVWHLLLE